MNHTESLKWLGCRDATINPKNINDRYFQYTFGLTQLNKEIKNHPERLVNIQPFLDLYNWIGIEYSTVIS